MRKAAPSSSTLSAAKRTLCAALVFLLLLALPSAISVAEDVNTRAVSAALIEASTGKVLFSKAAHQQMPMASTTKVMTAILALENCALSDMVETTREAYGTEGSSIYLELGETVSVEDLLYGLMLASGNDAAVALAVHIAGSVEGFAELMNQKARELGALNTHFVTPNGLHNDAHYTTAYDLARIAAYGLKNEGFKKLVSATYHRTSTGSVQRTFKNKNKLLWQYEGGNGIKTGYTKAAGRCLVFSAERGGMQLVGVVLNCNDMFIDASHVLDYGFEHYEMAKVVESGTTVARARVKSGTKNVLELGVSEDIMVPTEKGSSLTMRTRVVVDETIRAPVLAGDQLGVVELYEGDRLVISRPLVALSDVSAAEMGFYLNKLFDLWTA